MDTGTPEGVEIFIDTKITNNEEQTVQQALHRYAPNLKLKQYQYYRLSENTPEKILSSISHFNTNKHFAFIRRGNTITHWNSTSKTEEAVNNSPFENATMLIRHDEPDTGAKSLKQGSESGICYVCRGVNEDQLNNSQILEVFGNPHSSSLVQMF